MIFLKLKIDNFYMFKDTEIDFTYSKKIKNSTIEGEYLEEFPNIKYKKVCIFMGANASGKTTLGKLMCVINNYLCGSDISSIPKMIFDKEQNASIEITYIIPKTKKIHKLIIACNKDGLIKEVLFVEKLRKSYSLSKTLESLNNSDPQFTYKNQENKNHGITNPGFNSVAYSLGHKLNEDIPVWNYTYSDFNVSTALRSVTDLNLLETILKSFDLSIKEVKKIKESSQDSYIIKFSNDNEVVLEDRKISNPDRFSRGTIESIDIAHFINFLMENNNATLFLDEKMAYSHSEMESSILNLMIEKLKQNSQLFYTTHNHDILEMNLPTHSYVFMKKEEFVAVIHPEKLGYTKNDRGLLGFVKNDVFETLPNTAKIEELLYE